jgi:hypothetical protein
MHGLQWDYSLMPATTRDTLYILRSLTVNVGLIRYFVCHVCHLLLVLNRFFICKGFLSYAYYKNNIRWKSLHILVCGRVQKAMWQAGLSRSLVLQPYAILKQWSFYWNKLVKVRIFRKCTWCKIAKLPVIWHSDLRLFLLTYVLFGWPTVWQEITFRQVAELWQMNTCCNVFCQFGYVICLSGNTSANLRWRGDSLTEVLRDLSLCSYLQFITHNYPHFHSVVHNLVLDTAI